MSEEQDDQSELERLRRQMADLQAKMAALEASGGDQVARDRVEGDSVGGDKIAVSDVEEARAVAIGRQARATEIQAHIVHIYEGAPGEPQLDKAAFGRALDRYLEWVEQRYGRLNLRGIEKREQRALSLGLDEVYVSLEADVSPDRREVRAGSRSGKDDDSADGGPGTESGPVAVNMNQLLSLGPRLVITGGPGSGKTTFLQIIAASLAQALRSGEIGAVERYLGLKAKLPLPIFVPLSDYNRYRRAVGPAEDPRKGTLLAFISHYLIREQATIGLPDDFFERLLAEGRACILLLDGLDEVANERERLLVRRAVENLAHNRGVAFMVVASRSRAYQGEAVLPESFRPCAVRPLSPEQVGALAKRWCAAVYDAPDVVQEATALLAAIEALEALRAARGETRLVDSPLLVTIVAIVHYNQRRLPERRAELYEKCVDALLAERHHPATEATFELVDWGGTLPEKRGLLAYLAYQLMVAGEESGRSVDEDRLRGWLRPRFVRLRGETEADDALALFVRAMRERGSLLDERGGQYSFLHLTFQEYLCAYYLAENIREVQAIVAFLASEGRLTQAWWRETALLLAGYLGLKSEEAAMALARGLSGLSSDDATALAAAELAGSALLESDSRDRATRAAVAGRLATLLTDPELAAANEQRALAGRVLGWLGDPRPDVGCDVPFMVDIPAGPFLMGSKARYKLSYDRELPQHELFLSAYRIGRYPVTVAQFYRFAEAGGYREHRFWTEAGWQWQQEKNITEPRFWNDRRWVVPNHPVVGVSWFEAAAYCAWLSETTGRFFRLPDEAMWEKAARGTGGRIYPWGDDWDSARLNSGHDEINQTSAVGIFCGGRSPYDLYDCSGNVLEWCSGPADEYPFEGRSYEVDLGLSTTRALRGGAFSFKLGDVRAAYRRYGTPGLRLDLVGFRVVEHLS